jgi:hypothetical protein
VSRPGAVAAPQASGSSGSSGGSGGPSSFVRAAGLWCAAGAVVGVIGGLVTAFVPASVGTDRYSYPYTPTGYVIAEASFAVNHILLLVGLLGLARSGVLGDGRLGRLGVWTAGIGMAGLTGCEFVSMSLANSAYPTSRTDALDVGYGVSSLLIATGLILAGIAVVRARRWTGWARYIVLACGVGFFVFALPGLLAGFLAGRVGLSAWLLLWLALGLALTRPHPHR